MKRATVVLLLAILALGLLAAPLAAGAQKPSNVWRIGLFHVGLDHVQQSLAGLRQGLKDMGYAEGKNLQLDWRNLPDEQVARATARDFVRDRVDLILAFENETIRAAKAATTEIPIIFLHAPDPVGDGFVPSLARPGGNLTGLAEMAYLPGKRLEIFKELVPGMRWLLFLIDPKDVATGPALGEARKAAGILKLQVLEREAATEADIKRIFSGLKTGNSGGVFTVSPNFQHKFSSLILRSALTSRLPMATGRNDLVKEGALFSYGPDQRAIGVTASRYVDKILKGTKPAELPVEEPSKFELVVNLKTAKRLGLTIPRTVLIRADRVIE